MLKPPVRFLAYLAVSAATFSTGLALAQNSAADTSRELVCRGAQNAFVPSRWDDAVAGISKLQLNFSHSATAPGADGQGMQPGTCAWTTGVMSGTDLHQVNFVENPGGPTVEGRAASGTPGAGSQLHDSLNDPNRFWRFTIDGQQYGWYLASDHGPWQATLNAHLASPAAGATSAGKQAVASTALPPDLFQKDDNEMVAIGNRSVRAGDLKTAFQPAVDSLYRPPETYSRSRAPAAEGDSGGARASGVVSAGTLQAEANPAAAARTGVADAVGNKDLDFAAGEKLNCDREPPVLTQIKGTVAPGMQFTLAGFCLGDRDGRVDALGQLPGGKVSLPIVLWRHNAIVVTMPALTGISDQNLSFSAVRADGQPSAPLQTKMRVPRVRVDVPAHRWSPAPAIDAIVPYSGQDDEQRRDFHVAVNPACALDGMQATSSVGEVLRIVGFEDGPPHEAAVAIYSRRACTTTSRWTDNEAFLVAVGDDYESSTVCRIRYELAAAAYCPAGIAP